MAEAERRAEALAEESESLRLQLNARPTVKAFGALKRQLESLERQLARSHAGPDSAQPSLGARTHIGRIQHRMPRLHKRSQAQCLMQDALHHVIVQSTA